MKKILFNVLLSTLAMVFIVGCGESKKKDETHVTPINADNLSSLQGNYEIQGFINNTPIPGLGLTFAYKCAELQALMGADNVPCDPTKDVNLASQAVISGSDASNMALQTKVQMWGGSFGDVLSNSSLATVAKDNAYNYTKYGAARLVTPANGSTEFASATGVSGRDMVKVTSDNNSSSSFVLLSDGRLLVSNVMDVNVNGLIIRTNTSVLLKKVNDNPSEINPDALVNSSVAGFDTFKPFLGGTYTVTFFGTQVTNPQPDSFASFASAFYISNDCAKAKELYPDIVNVGGKNGCTFVAGDPDNSSQTVLQKGLISLALKDGQLYVTSKMEMVGGGVELSPADKYQYTTYNPVAYNGESSVSGTGLQGYNYDADNDTISETAIDFASSPFTINFDSNGNIDIAMTLMGKQALEGALTLDAVTRVQATKTGSYAPLENEIETVLQ